MSQEKSNEKWYYILAKDKSCQGYFPGVIPEDACNKFGKKPKDCKVIEVIKTNEGFQWKNNTEQLKLF